MAIVASETLMGAMVALATEVDSAILVVATAANLSGTIVMAQGMVHGELVN